jgi:DEAD/DEAH box helicase domain-containing protein
MDGYSGQIAHLESIPPQEPRHEQLDHPLSDILNSALIESGVERFYTHQARAINAVRREENIFLATATASGKTLCYNVPVLEALIEDRRARALYLFPTKALSQDQLSNLRLLTRGLGDPVIGTYDGDTPRSHRSVLRRRGSIILTNPDMLHMGILPNHSLWKRFLANLRFVVVDEAHTYRGIFGSHVACVLRRLRRLCEFYGSTPQFICCSATIANPEEHGLQLTGLPATIVDEDGSPRGEREFIFWNPPWQDPERSARRSSNSEAVLLLTELVKASLRAITFTRTRKVAELILLYAREALMREAPELASLIRSYRAGYLPEDRREIEQGLFQGELLGVTATNALELGIDVGMLDATVLVGYPGTVASTWQQAGRSGRDGRHALTVLIGQDNPLDQYFMRHPEALLHSSLENAIIDPDNVHVLMKHLPCAAYEWPLTDIDHELFGPGFADAMAAVERDGTLIQRNERWYPAAPNDYPAEGVHIRNVSGDSFLLVDETQGGCILEEIEADSVSYRTHPGAIYLHQGDSYQVRDLDFQARVAYLRPVDVEYYTQTKEISEVQIQRQWKSRTYPASHAHLGEVRVTQKVTGYMVKSLPGDAILQNVSLDLPECSYDTVALWFDIPDSAVVSTGQRFQGGLHAVEHATIAMLPLFAMCDRSDIGGVSVPAHPDMGPSQVFVYDGHPGGTGIAEKGFELLRELWQATLRAIEECPCESGCPSCIQSPKCGSNNEPLDKAAAISIMRSLLTAG